MGRGLGTKLPLKGEKTPALWRDHIPFAGQHMYPLVGSHYLAPGFPRRKVDPGYLEILNALEILNGSLYKKYYINGG